MFKSKLEQEQWKTLQKKLKRSKVKAYYEVDKIPYTVIEHHNYHPDITLVFPDGHKRFIEIKGYFRAEDRKKMKFVKDQNPSIDLRLVFARDNKMNKSSKTTYSMWAKKHHIPYAIGETPKGWLNRDG